MHKSDGPLRTMQENVAVAEVMCKNYKQNFCFINDNKNIYIETLVLFY